MSYGPSFFPFDYGPSANHKSMGKKRGSVACSTDRENEVSKIFIISLRLIGRAEKKNSTLAGRPAKLTNHSARTKLRDIINEMIPHIIPPVK